MEEVEATEEALMNIACNEFAGELTEAAVDGERGRKAEKADTPELLQPPYQGSKAMLKIKGKWVTSEMKEELYRARRTPPA